MNRRFALKTLAIFGATPVLSACASLVDDGEDLFDIVTSKDEFSTLAAAIRAAGLTQTMRSDGPFTLFAPTNSAFSALPDGTVDRLLMPANRGQLASILSYHLVRGAVTSDRLAGGRFSLPTVQGSRVRIDGRRGVRVDNATVVIPDIIATNGVLHVIDKVIIP